MFKQKFPNCKAIFSDAANETVSMAVVALRGKEVATKNVTCFKNFPLHTKPGQPTSQ